MFLKLQKIVQDLCSPTKTCSHTKGHQNTVRPHGQPLPDFLENKKNYPLTKDFSSQCGKSAGRRWNVGGTSADRQWTVGGTAE